MKDVEFEILQKDGYMSEFYYSVKYNGNTFYISVPKYYPFKPLKVNGLTISDHYPSFKISNILDILISSKVKNTLVYCHNKPYVHFLTDNWINLFGDDFTNSNKIYFDLNKNVPSRNVFTGNGFGEEVLSYNYNLWDFIMIPDCGVLERKKSLGGLYNLTINSDDRRRDAPEALKLLKRILLNLKVNGKLWLTKTITIELIKLMILELGQNYSIQFIKYQYDSDLFEIVDYKEKVSGVIITRIV